MALLQTLTLSLQLAVLFLLPKTMALALSTTGYPSTTTLTSTTDFQTTTTDFQTTTTDFQTTTTDFQTTTPPVCMLWGIPRPDLRPGEATSTSCEHCYCDLNYQAQCMRAMCTTPAYCTNPVLRPGECCPYCETLTTTDMPTTTPSGCVLDNGTILPEGEEIVTKMYGSCQMISCRDSQLATIYADCIPAMCVDALETNCCQYCPNGQNCRLPNGSLLYGSNPQEIDGMTCQCPEQSYQFGVQTEEHITALCTASNLTTPFSTSTTTQPELTTTKRKSFGRKPTKKPKSKPKA